MSNVSHPSREGLFEQLGKLLLQCFCQAVPGSPEAASVIGLVPDLLTEEDRAFAYCKASTLSYSRAGEVLGLSYTQVAKRVTDGELVLAKKGEVTALSVYRYALGKAHKLPMNVLKKKRRAS